MIKKFDIDFLGQTEQFYAKVLLSVENLTTAFYKFGYQFNMILPTMLMTQKFFKQEYPSEYVDAKEYLERALLEYQKIITDSNYGIIRMTHLNAEYGYSAYRFIQCEKRVMTMIQSFNELYTDKNMTEESYTYAGLSYLESLFNTISIMLSKIAEIFPIPKQNEEEKTENENTESEEESTPRVAAEDVDVIEPEKKK